MPKHVPTFKHLIHTSHQPQKSTAPPEKSVLDLLLSSRHSRSLADRDGEREREAPPHLVGSTANPGRSDASSVGQRVWSPSTVVVVGGTEGAGLVDIEQGTIHPAEILRRSRISHRHASRSVAGPAPPPSWQAPPNLAAGTIKVTGINPGPPASPITAAQLNCSSSLFSVPPQAGSTSGSGRRRLVEYCFEVVLRYLEDETVLYDVTAGADTEDDICDGGAMVALERKDFDVYTMGRIIREQVAYLEPHLKAGLLAVAATLPESHPGRMSDRSFLSVLAEPPPEPSLDEDKAQISSSWEDPPSTSASILTLPHLPLTLHQYPQTLLRQVPVDLLHGLTSLNLAYCTLPGDLERLVALLPHGLRELGLAGVKVGGKAGEEGLRRGFGAVGRKLIVLRMIDLSYPRFGLSPRALSALLHPASSKLPSLRLLGLRGVISVGHILTTSGRDLTDGDREDCRTRITGSIGHEGKERGPVADIKREWIDVVKGGQRAKYVDIVW